MSRHHLVSESSVNRSWRDQDQPIMSGPFAMLIHMGTLEGTKHKPWTWILGAPLVTLKEAGVHFDPEVRGLKAIQGDAQSGSALEERVVALHVLLWQFHELMLCLVIICNDALSGMVLSF